MTDLWVTVVFCVMGLLIHITGLILLHKHDDRDIYGTQKYLITTLSLTEMSFLVITVVRDYIFYKTDLPFHLGMIVSNYKTLVLADMYYLTMFGITIDRFLQIFLNLKYDLYWNMKKTKKVLLISFILLNLLYFTYLSVILASEKYDLPLKVFKNFHTYVTPIYYTTFLITAAAVYFYIFGKIYKNQKAHERCKRDINSEKDNANKKSSYAKYLTPFWIIVTFIMFQILPDILLTIKLLYPLPYHEKFRTAIVVLIRIGFIADPIIYIYSLEFVKNKMRRIKVFNAS